jgi:GNAT superfamily N-acetyltransferase
LISSPKRARAGVFNSPLKGNPPQKKKISARRGSTFIRADKGTVVCRSYTTADLSSASVALKRSFDIDPTMRDLNTDMNTEDEGWEKNSASTFGWYCWVNHASYGMVDVAENSEVPGDIQAVAIWEPGSMSVGAGLRNMRMLLWVWWKQGFGHLMRVIDFGTIMEKKRAEHAPTAHHLVLLGSKVQGHAVGAKLLQVGIDRADARGLPCYLESSNVDNIQFYERFGFRVVESLYPFENDAMVEGKQRGSDHPHAS